MDTKKSTSLSLGNIITVLNSGLISYVKVKYGINNKYHAGFEAMQKRKQDLQRLHVLGEKLEKPQIDGNVYQFDLLKTKKPFLLKTRVNFLLEKGNCKACPAIGLDIQTDDLNLPDAFMKPSFDWREVPFRIAEDKVHAESDGTFQIPFTVLDYLRYPVEMDIEGYRHADGTPSKNVDCELSFPEEVIDQAVLEYKLWLQDPNYQFAQMKQTINE